MKDRSLAVGTALIASAIAGGLAGGLLSAYWWDFPPEDMERWGTETIILYSALGVFGGLVIGGFLIAATCTILDLRARSSPGER